MNKCKTAIKVICFILILAVILTSADRVLKVKYVDGIYSMQRFYELDNDSVDVLFLGSSHAFETYNTSVLWDEYGIASFVLGGSVQPMWNTYFYMKEALKTQTPELIVLEAFSCVFEMEYSDYSRQIKNCYGMKPSMNKIAAMWESNPHTNINFYVPISNYSSRYSELTKEDFLKSKDIPRYENWMGFGSNYINVVEETPCLKDTYAEEPMLPKVEKYYRKILQLANDKKIPIMVVVTPYPDITAKQAAIYKTAERIAGEYNVDFYNPALDPASVGLDFSIHAAEARHLNSAGNRIFTSHFGDYIKTHYSIHDRRGNPEYQAWEKCSQFIKRLDSINQMNNLTDYEVVCQKIQKEQYCAFIVVGKNVKDSEMLIPFGIAECEPNRLLYFVNGQTMNLQYNTDKVTYQRIYLLFHDDIVYADRNRLANEYTADEKTVKIVVYDKVTDNICDVFMVSETDPKVVIR
ncbi:MAG: hypothetical protein K6D93_05680 [Saccharofermentans sp.]|nr:hypothetical protein [Saccharofermentans sp.]